MADIVPTHLAVQAMRDNGYKNAAYAIAELMDNSIQAEATKVELLCGEKEVFVAQRTMRRIHQVAVLDNGSGMNGEVLTMALQFGNGTHLDPSQQKGIGRFGMGLPASSISQAKRVDVWTWQQGPESAIYSYLDLDEIKSQKTSSVPEPIQKVIPSVWRAIGKAFEKSGTLVVWSNLDRCIWRTAKAIIDNSELIIGRMYRCFLEDNRVTIRMAAFDFDNPEKFAPELLLGNEFFAKPNDPGYLMSGTSCPAPYDNKPMFTPWGEDNYESIHTISFQGQKHDVKIRFSIAHKEARDVPNAGATPHGKHAARNIGVSILRADRELELDQSWVLQYDPRERWWGVEVEFPPSLDELFGVTNNKQSARNFSELAKIDIDSLLKDKTILDLKEEFIANEDPRGPLIEIALRIDTQLSVMRNEVG